MQDLPGHLKSSRAWLSLVPGQYWDHRAGYRGQVQAKTGVQASQGSSQPDLKPHGLSGADVGTATMAALKTPSLVWGPRDLEILGNMSQRVGIQTLNTQICVGVPSARQGQILYKPEKGPLVLVGLRGENTQSKGKQGQLACLQ